MTGSASIAAQLRRSRLLAPVVLAFILVSATSAVAHVETGSSSASAVVLDDAAGPSTHGGFAYIGPWSIGRNARGYLGSDHYSDRQGAQAVVSFTGTSIKLYGAKAPWHGKASIAIDGGTPSIVDFYRGTRLDQALVYSSPQLAAGPHRLVITVLDQRNSASKGDVVAIDRVAIGRVDITSPPAITKVENSSSQVRYVGGWSTSSSRWKSGGTDHYSSMVGATASLSFNGTKVTWRGAKAPWHGKASVSVDGGPATAVDLYNSYRKDQQPLYTSPTLSPGFHTLTIKVGGFRNSASSGNTIAVDHFLVENADPMSKSAPAAPTLAAPLTSVPAGEPLQAFISSKSVEKGQGNLSMPSPGVSRVRYVRGQMDGYTVLAPISPRREAFFTYQVKVPQVVHDTGLAEIDLKMPGLGGIPAGKSQWHTSSGGNLKRDSWSIRLHARNSDSYNIDYPWWHAYIYAPSANGQTFKDWGIQVPLSTKLNGAGTRLPIPADRWFEVKMRVKMNTPGVNNGHLDVWVDGVKGVQLTDVQWNRSGSNSPINQFMGTTFYNNPGAPRDGYIDYKDFRITPVS